jgi:hypothetical protein
MSDSEVDIPDHATRWRRQQEARELERKLAAAEQRRQERADTAAGTGYVQKSPESGVRYTTPLETLQAGFPEAETNNWDGWENWLQGHLDLFHHELFNRLDEDINRLLDGERNVTNRALADLRAENAELKGMIGTVLKQLDTLTTAVEDERKNHQVTFGAVAERLAHVSGKLGVVGDLAVGAADRAGLLQRGFKWDE